MEETRNGATGFKMAYKYMQELMSSSWYMYMYMYKSSFQSPLEHQPTV